MPPARRSGNFHLWEEYHELIKSDVADYKNHGGRPGGAITAAAFLTKFVGGYPWVHLDIAGPAWLTKAKPYIPKGGFRCRCPFDGAIPKRLEEAE